MVPQWVTSGTRKDAAPYQGEKMDPAIELVQNIVQETMSKSNVFCSLTIIFNKNGEASITNYIPEKLTPVEKILATSLIAAGASTVAAQHGGILCNFVKINLLGKRNGS
jgi:hypothetical protein